MCLPFPCLSVKTIVEVDDQSHWKSGRNGSGGGFLS
jgi:hypothetical protein